MSWFRRRGRGPEHYGPQEVDLRALAREQRRLPAELDHLTPEEAAEHGERLRTWYDGAPDSERMGTARGLMQLEERAGQVRGRSYVEWVPELDRLRAQKDDDQALGLLMDLIEAAERAARVSGREPAPGYTERAAVIYRRRKDYAGEIAIIERWEGACPPERRGPGATQGRLAERLAKARALAARDVGGGV